MSNENDYVICEIEMPEHLLAKIEHIAKKKNMSCDELMNLWIEQYLAEIKQTTPPV